ncbi:cbb3-type cytochrome oxidase subunit 3 [Ectothiorhodospira shaposhnikovii]|uniref:cbb3-type cytochrome oxidase subunit 3 n=1 Tax=Ectothiorhodospira shaposhnikovii TaxID=1054 RepID=UPI001EE7D737|nr:cbb3-type cytochrome c oxidase subunit 3 [Ectothiorhodospira shaposhnikovii]MCG5513311.1 cbb3-type cytochrome c oxidase subunit 3 [Ectothiorhodospira shaposhnikovii]
MDLWYWITDLNNSKMVALLLFFSTFVGILIYLFSSRKRSERLESYRFIPFDDDEPDQKRQDGKHS